MQIPVLNGIYTDTDSDFRTAYPRNLVPVPKEQGISKGYLRPAEGVELFGSAPGIDRGGISYKNTCYRVMGTKFVLIHDTGVCDTLADVGSGGQCTFDYSFDYLAVNSGGRLYYWNGTTLAQVTDSDLGYVRDFVWVDGYFMATDGASLIVTDLNDPFSVNPLKYGSAEADPDDIKGLIKLRNEVYALNRYTVEVFQNVGGTNVFPFQRIEGAQLMRGSIGTFSCCIYLASIAFLGSGRNEPPAVWLGANGATVKLSTREIDTLLLGYDENVLAQVVMESRVVTGHQFLYLHLPDQTLVYDAEASRIVQEPVWFTLTTSIVGSGLYRAKNFVWCYNSWLCGDPQEAQHGKLTSAVSSHYGVVNGWDFGTVVLYNDGKGALFHELELVCLTGNVDFSAKPVIWTSYSMDGITWSQEMPRSAGNFGERNKRISWLEQGYLTNWRIQKFRGTSDAHLSVARLEARLEQLNV